MKPHLSSKRNAGLSLFEVGLVVAVGMILIVVLFPMLNRPRTASRLYCVNNLKQIGLAYRIWEGDNNDIYPMGISVTNGGSMEMVVTGNVLQTFLLMSNELSTPKILFCPQDTARMPATSFSFPLTSRSVSYFVGVDVTNDSNPQLIISGDSNFEIRSVPVKSGLQSFWTNDPVEWDSTRHVRTGNIGLADGSVQSTTSPSLQNHLRETGLATNRFAIP